MSIDLRFICKSDGLYRICILCGHEFKIASTVVTTKQIYKDGKRYISAVRFGDRHPYNLLQLTCAACAQASYVDPARGSPDPRAQLRYDGLESWRDNE